MSATQIRTEAAFPVVRDETRSDRIRLQVGKYATIGLLLLPGMLLFVLFVLIPIGKAAQYSIYEWRGFGPLVEKAEVRNPDQDLKVLGVLDVNAETWPIGNYEHLYHQEAFRRAVKHSFLIMGMSLAVQLPLAMFLALMVGRGYLPGKKLFRAILFVPFVFSEPITAIIWLYVLHPKEGMANVVFDRVIPGFTPQTWLGDKEIIMYSIFAVLTWRFFGFHMILYMAGLQGVPRDLEDAARVDGASERQVLQNITLPLLGSTIRLTIFLSVLGSFQQFVIVWILTKGGNPANFSHLISTYLYKFGIKTFYLGYGSAIAVVLFAGTLIFSIIYQRLVMRRDYVN